MKKLFLISFLGLLAVSLFFNLGIFTRNRAFADLIDEDLSQPPGYDPDTPTAEPPAPLEPPEVEIPPDIFGESEEPVDIDTSDVSSDIPSVFPDLENIDIEEYLPPEILLPEGGLDASGATRTGCPTEGLVPCGTPGCPCTFCDFFVMFDRIVDFVLFRIIPPVAALMLAIGGFMYILAYAGPAELLTGGGKGSPKMLSQAKILFKSVIIGLLIIYAAWIIINTFFFAVGVADWTGLREGWWSIECP